MTKDDIIRMAVQCQLVTTGNRDGVYMDALERFAALVAAAEREACAKVCDARYMGDNNREDMEARRCADLIRARGEK
jgi:hypothetical protein